MKARISRMAVSFAIVLVAYWAYALWIVPWIEPPAARPQDANQVSAEELQKARDAARHDPRRAMLAALFGPEDWELGQRAKILESEQFRLLVEDWNTLDDNQVELRPCTMVFTPGGPESLEERMRQSVVLQAPQGARLRFDRPLDLRRGNIGRLVGGVLVGTITVRSAGRLPGPEDDLWAITRDLQLTDEGAWTAHDVEFHYGPHFGRGAKLLIKFVPGERGTAEYHGPNIGGIESLELRHVERVYVGPQVGPANRRDNSQANNRAAPPLSFRPAEAKPHDRSSLGTLGPLELTCRGPLRFDVARQLATFEEHVRLQRLNRSGPADELQCDLLAIYFARRRPPVAGPGPADKSRAFVDLEPRRLEARGRPAVIRAPSQDLDARAEMFQYDLVSRRLSLQPFAEDPAAPGKAVAVRQGGNEIHAPSLEYELGEHGQWGHATAPGPGWVRLEVKDRPGQNLVARWQQELRLRPQDQEHVVSLLGGAELGYGGFGVLSALEIYFWMRPVPDPTAGGQMQPDRMLARQQVRLDSLQLSGAVDQLEVWFEPQPADPAPRVTPPASRPGRDPRLETMRTAVDLSTRIPSALEEVWRPLNEAGQRLGLSGGSKSDALSTPGVPPAPIRLPPRPAADPRRRFDITGRLLRARVVTADNQADVAELMVEGKVHFLETRTTRPDDKPLVVKGDRVHLLDPAQPYAAATVVGNPAQFQARGLALSGSNINLNRGTNRLWTEGPGRLEIVLDRDFSGQPIAGGLPVTIRWRERMALEGATLRFEEAVHVTSRLDQLQTDTLEIGFKEPIALGDPEKQSRPEVQRVRCRGGVVLESQAVDAQGPLAWQRVEVTDLALDVVSGAATGSGPGEVRIVRRGSASARLNRNETPAAAAKADVHLQGPGGLPAEMPLETLPRDSSGLSYLEVRFQRGASGNFRQRRLSFEGQVSAVLGPVSAWDERLSADRPETLGPRGAVLRCDQLAVAQMPVPGTGNLSLELEAVGNTLVEGQQYTARAHRITYAEAKDLLVLEGDGRNDAQLFRQTYPGGPVSATAARRIQYWPSLRKGSVDGPRFLEHQASGAPSP